MAFVALGFFSLIFHFGKSPPLSIKPEVHRVGEKTENPAKRDSPRENTFGGVLARFP